MTVIVWLFFILSTGPLEQHQAIDKFPTFEACQAFRANVQQMLDMGLAPGGRVSQCEPRPFVSTP